MVGSWKLTAFSASPLMISDFKFSTDAPSDDLSSAMICLAIFAYLGFNSMPYELRPARRAATKVEPVPAIGSSTISPFLVKNSMNSCAIVSGNLAGCTNTPFLRGGGLWMNHDFWNLSQVFGSRSLSLLVGMFMVWVSSLAANRSHHKRRNPKT